jgi:hypothetical protein
MSLSGYNRGNEHYPTTVMAVHLGLTSFHVIMEMETQARTHMLKCNQQWKPKYTNFVQSRKFFEHGA